MIFFLTKVALKSHEHPYVFKAPSQVDVKAPHKPIKEARTGGIIICILQMRKQKLPSSNAVPNVFIILTCPDMSLPVKLFCLE